MTEAGWLCCARTGPMLRLLIGTDGRVQDIDEFPECKGSDRKLRLFACACYHRIGRWLPDPAARAAVEAGERLADGRASWAELEDAERRVRALSTELEPVWRASHGAERAALEPSHTALSLALVVAWREPQKAAFYASSNAYLGLASITHPGAGVSDAGFGAAQADEERAQCGLLRDIFGPLLFRPVAIDPAWLTADVVGLARAAYDLRAFNRLPVLADALQDAGCGDADVLSHCLSGGPHVRGCWVIDLLLGKD